MSTFNVEIEIGDPEGGRWETVEALVDTGSSYSVLPRPMLEGLGVPPHTQGGFRLADDRVLDREIGQTWLRVDGKSVITLVVFGENGSPPILGAYALEGLLLAADPVGHRLIPVEGLLMRSERAKAGA